MSTPLWNDNYLRELATIGGTLAEETYTPYGGPRIADFTTDQEDAFAAMRDSTGMWQPYANTASQQFAGAQSGLEDMRDLTTGVSGFNRLAAGQTDASGNPLTGTALQPMGSAGEPAFSQFYDVYDPVVQRMQDEAQRIGSQNFNNTTLAELNRNFTGSGQFGTGRHQILGQDAAVRAQTEIEGLQAGVESQARQQAMQDYLNWGKQGLSAGQQMGQFAGNQSKLGTDLMNFGMGMQNATQGDAQTLMGIGQQEQQMTQQNYNLAQQDYQNQQNFPWQQLQRWSTVLNNQTPSMQLPTAPQQQTAANPWTQGIAGGLGAWSALRSAF